MTAQMEVVDPQPATYRGDLAVLYREHSGAVYGLVHRVCGPAFAPDVTQEVFVRFWKDPSRFEPARGSLRSFLLSMANSRAIDVVRSEYARRGGEERSAWEYPMRVGEALNDLPAPERDAIVSAYYGGCSYREAAEALGTPEETIKSRIRAGLTRLRSDLGDLPAVR